MSGSNVLYIACEAVETVINENEKAISSDTFRRHYKVTKNGAVSIWQSQFLKVISDASKDICTGSDSNYNGFIATAWGQFKRDMGNTSKKKHLLKHQKYFEDILKGITTSNPTLGDRVTLLLQFVKKNMRGNFQPYRSIVDLHKKIDHDSDMDNEGIIDELEKIHIKFDQICFEKKISKPRILYSIMVSK